MQIGKRVRWLERAELARERQRMGRNLNTRYDVPNSQNDRVNIYSFVSAHQGDPAIAVCLPFQLKETVLWSKVTLGLHSEIKRQHPWSLTQSKLRRRFLW
jgi:hypothetical protein